MDQLPYFSFFRHKKIKKIFSNFRHPTLFSFDSLRQEVNSVFIKSVPSWENRHITSVGRDRSFVCIYLGAHNVDGSSWNLRSSNQDRYRVRLFLKFSPGAILQRFQKSRNLKSATLIHTNDLAPLRHWCQILATAHILGPSFWYTLTSWSKRPKWPLWVGEWPER